MKTLEKSKLKFCSFSCVKAESRDPVPGCLASNPIYCLKYDKPVQKGAICLSYRKK